ncbi:unnamed protein product, partial [Timema podura]|nr:unnamed protein product [Timema podura]
MVFIAMDNQKKRVWDVGKKSPSALNLFIKRAKIGSYIYNEEVCSSIPAVQFYGKPKLKDGLSCSPSSLENDKDILELNRIYSIGNSDVCELMIFDNKGNKKLFCDEAVYTKNRHFRLFMSTKRGKSSPLVVSKENNFKPSEINVFSNENSNCACSIDDYSASENMFLHSLITYFPANEHINILECNHVNEICTANVGKTKYSGHSLEDGTKSPYPEVDSFIRELVTPMGRIWRSCYFSSNNLLSYDIVGYRYCNNIGRQHRSNNIKYIVDLANYCYYQKCYDPDCFNYRSMEIPLPPELVFHLEDRQFLCSDDTSSQSTQGCFGMPTGDFTQVLEAIEGIGFTGIFEDSTDWHKELVAPPSLDEAKQEFPDYGVSDTQLLNIMDGKQNKKSERLIDENEVERRRLSLPIIGVKKLSKIRLSDDSQANKHSGSRQALRDISQNTLRSIFSRGHKIAPERTEL